MITCRAWRTVAPARMPAITAHAMPRSGMNSSRIEPEIASAREQRDDEPAAGHGTVSRLGQ